MLPAAGGDAAAAAAPPAHTDETFGSLAQALSALATEAAETASEGAVRATAGSQPVVAAATNEGAAVGNGAVPDSSAQPEQRLVPKPPLPRRTPGSRATTTARAGAGSGRRSRGKKQPAEVDMDQALQQFASCIDRDIEELNARFIDSDDISFAAWKQHWQDARMSAAFHVEFWNSSATATHKVVLQQSLDALLDCIDAHKDGFSDRTAVARLFGFVFGLYCAYSVQLGSPKHKIDIVPHGWASLMTVDAVSSGVGAELFPLAAKEVRAVMRKLVITENAFLKCLRGFSHVYHIGARASSVPGNVRSTVRPAVERSDSDGDEPKITEDQLESVEAAVVQYQDLMRHISNNSDQSSRLPGRQALGREKSSGMSQLQVPVSLSGSTEDGTATSLFENLRSYLRDRSRGPSQTQLHDSRAHADLTQIAASSDQNRVVGVRQTSVSATLSNAGDRGRHTGARSVQASGHAESGVTALSDNGGLEELSEPEQELSRSIQDAHTPQGSTRSAPPRKRPAASDATAQEAASRTNSSMRQRRNSINSEKSSLALSSDGLDELEAELMQSVDANRNLPSTGGIETTLEATVPSARVKPATNAVRSNQPRHRANPKSRSTAPARSIRHPESTSPQRDQAPSPSQFLPSQSVLPTAETQVVESTSRQSPHQAQAMISTSTSVGPTGSGRVLRARTPSVADSDGLSELEAELMRNVGESAGGGAAGAVSAVGAVVGVGAVGADSSRLASEPASTRATRATATPAAAAKATAKPRAKRARASAKESGETGFQRSMSRLTASAAATSATAATAQPSRATPRQTQATTSASTSVGPTGSGRVLRARTPSVADSDGLSELEAELMRNVGESAGGGVVVPSGVSGAASAGELSNAARAGPSRTTSLRSSTQRKRASTVEALSAPSRRVKRQKVAVDDAVVATSRSKTSVAVHLDEVSSSEEASKPTPHAQVVGTRRDSRSRYLDSSDTESDGLAELESELRA